MNEQGADNQKNNLRENMRLVSVGSQAGIFDTRLVSGFIMDILQKLHDIHQTYQSCSEDLAKGRTNLNESEQTLTTMQTTLGTFNDTVDSLGVHLLLENSTLANKHIAVERLRKDVAVKRAHVAELSRNMVCPKELQGREQQLYKLKDERAKLELQLAKLNSDIDSTYEEMFTAQERLYGIKDLRENHRTDQITLMGSLTEKCNNMNTKKSELLAITDPDAIIDMHDIYVSPTQFKQLQADIDILKHKQVQIDRHIQMQLEERDFLRSTVEEISEKVYDIERKVRKETGDHGFESHKTEEPNWYQDLGSPNVWFSSPKLTHDQLKMLIENQSRELRCGQARTETEIPGTSAESHKDSEIIISDTMV